MSNLGDNLNKAVQAEAPKVGNWFQQTVWPRWVTGLAFLVGLFVGALSKVL